MDVNESLIAPGLLILSQRTRKYTALRLIDTAQ